MNTKSSAHYQREFRKRLREQGLVKKEIWIRPERSKELAELEKILRRSPLLANSTPTNALSTTVKASTGITMNDNAQVWTTLKLHEALREQAPLQDGQVSVQLIDGVEPSLQLDMHEYGDLPIFITVYGEQIIVEAMLWPAADVRDPQRFNDTVLRTHKYFPLSTISLDTLADGQSYYHMFGALSATSRMVNVLLEIETLARNVIQATEAYGEFLLANETV
ncbi:MAG: hypothetical protein ACI8W7_003782 [Gammaproteobacteria bacterium]|jgi:uncharacterized protein YjfI (DUF2170 family)